MIFILGLAFNGNPALANSEFCARHLAPSVYKNLRDYVPDQATSSVLLSNSVPSIAYHATKETVGDQVVLRLGFETSTWTAEEFDDWRSLEAMSAHPTFARAEVERITRTDYCPAGVLPYLCTALRHSHRMASRALQKTLSYAHPGATDFSYYSCLFHMGRDLIRFPWCRSTKLKYPQMRKDCAARVFEIFAQESYVRHLELAHPTGQVFTGADLSLETRLILAVAPSLRPIAFWFVLQPLDYFRTMVYGDDSTAATTLIAARLRDPGHPMLVAFLEPKQIPSSLFRVILVRDEFKDPSEMEIWRREAQAKLRSLLNQFRRETRLELAGARLKISAGRTGSVVEFKNLRVDLQILFTYYVAERWPHADLR